jgi:hypothetical protein
MLNKSINQSNTSQMMALISAAVQTSNPTLLCTFLHNSMAKHLEIKALRVKNYSIGLPHSSFN